MHFTVSPLGVQAPDTFCTSIRSQHVSKRAQVSFPFKCTLVTNHPRVFFAVPVASVAPGTNASDVKALALEVPGFLHMKHREFWLLGFSLGKREGGKVALLSSPLVGDLSCCLGPLPQISIDKVFLGTSFPRILV